MAYGNRFRPKGERPKRDVIAPSVREMAKMTKALKKGRRRAIREHQLLTLSEESRKPFVEALLNPPKPNQKSIAAARRLRQEIE